MNIQYVNPFLLASYSVLESLLGKPPARGLPRVQAATFASEECSVICGITGQAQGQVIYGMSRQTALDIAGAMIGSPVQDMDVLASSAIAELGNMISGGATRHLFEAGIVCDITPPSLLQGCDICVSTLGIAAIVVPLTTAQGSVTVTVGLQARG